MVAEQVEARVNCLSVRRCELPRILFLTLQLAMTLMPLTLDDPVAPPDAIQVELIDAGMLADGAAEPGYATQTEEKTSAETDLRPFDIHAGIFIGCSSVGDYW